MTKKIFVGLLVAANAVLLSTAGCELIASIDRDKIPQGTGGAGGAGGGTPSTSTSPATSTSSSTTTTQSSTTSTGSTGGGGANLGGGGANPGGGGTNPGGGGANIGGANTGGANTGGANAGGANTGTGGSGGACLACTTSPDAGAPVGCPNDTACTFHTCEVDGCCAQHFVPTNQPLPTGQTPGNCQVAECDGAGHVISVDDVSDLPTAPICKVPHCTGSPLGPSFTSAGLGASCSDGLGGKFCTATDTCVQCNVTVDCPATGNECAVPNCDGSNKCTPTDLGNTHTLSTGQTAGDCQRVVCDGAGGTTHVDDLTDVPALTSACQINPTCAGSPAAPHTDPAPTGTDCTADGQLPKHVCGDVSDSSAGKCVECNSGTDCSGGNTTCTLHVCTP